MTLPGSCQKSMPIIQMMRSTVTCPSDDETSAASGTGGGSELPVGLSRDEMGNLAITSRAGRVGGGSLGVGVQRPLLKILGPRWVTRSRAMCERARIDTYVITIYQVGHRSCI